MHSGHPPGFKELPMIQGRLSGEQLWLPNQARHSMLSGNLAGPLSCHPALLGPSTRLVLNPSVSMSVTHVILTAESQLYRKETVIENSLCTKHVCAYH